ncbi:MAG: hypothetical protein LBS21_15480 [Clostridiales bacterium]|jgi:hypothetical protein|nr:hypothetical protein [Clostridiales bacterium]
MILFMMAGDPKTEPPYTIASVYSAAPINAANAWFVSWNEAKFVAGSTEFVFTDIEKLKNAVFHVAANDTLCKDIAFQCKALYGMDIFAARTEPDKHLQVSKIINDVFESWPHPMIGNVLVSSGFRPQDKKSQYDGNWNSFPEKYMNAKTKTAINSMINNPESVKLSPLKKSGRDQVRICKDMTELARAVMGEISTYASKKLEKIFALELCQSDNLLMAQRELIKLIIDAVNQSNLKNLFTAKGFSSTEYLSFYLPEVKTLTDKQHHWVVFANIVNWALDNKKLPDADTTDSALNEKLAKYKVEMSKFPLTMQCAMVINAIRKLILGQAVKRYSIASKDETSLNSNDYVIGCEVKDAAGKDFIPELVTGSGRRALLWNWMRDEGHIATKTYRHYLMPLWAGPSGHTTGLIEVYTQRLNSTQIKVGEGNIPVALIIMSSMFAFWRLFYDKRICAVHTLAETFEAVFSTGLHSTSDSLPAEKKTEIDGYIHLEEEYIKDPKIEKYTDAFNALLAYGSSTKEYVHSVRIMTQIKAKHFTTLEGLDVTLKKLRESFAKSIVIPQWSKPVMNETLADSAAYETAFATAKNSITVQNFYTGINVRTFKPESLEKFKITRSAAPSKALKAIYEKIASSKLYNFEQDFENLPNCITQSGITPFLSGISFNVKSCVLENTAVSFVAQADTTARFFNSIKQIIPLKGTEDFLCAVTETENGLVFEGEIKVDYAYKAAENFWVKMDSVVLRTGLGSFKNAPGTQGEFAAPPVTVIAGEFAAQQVTVSAGDTPVPSVSVKAGVSHGADVFGLTLLLSLTDSSMYITGEYEHGKVLTISKLLSVFGMDGIIPASLLLPDDESIFGSLGLREVSIRITQNPLCVSNIAFTVTAEKPWAIYGNKIKLQPYFEMDIDYPFNGDKRQAGYTVLSKWFLGKTVFNLSYRSDKTVNLELAQDSELNFAEIAKLFEINVKFPEIIFTGLNMSLSLTDQNFSMYLTADDLLKFDVGKTKIGISDSVFSLDFINGKFGKLQLTGTLILGGLSLNLSGKYSAGGGFSFSAAYYNSSAFSLKDFAAQVSKDISGNFNPAYIPANFLNVSIRTVAVSYDSDTGAFLALAQLENVLQISDKFSIESFALKVSLTKNKAAEFEILAAALICQTTVSLLIAKKNNDFIISGSASFANLTFKSIAGEFGIDTSILPDFINDFSVSNLSLNYNFTQKVFSFSAATSAGLISAEIASGEKSAWSISYKTNPSMSVDMLNLPLVGDMVKKTSPEIADFSVKDFEIAASQESGAVFKCVALGKDFALDIYKPEKVALSDTPGAVTFSETPETLTLSEISGAVALSKEPEAFTLSDTPEAMKWLEIGKSFSIVSIQKVGIGLDKSKAVLLLDASLTVNPLTFILTEAGLGVDIKNPADISFYLSGFGVKFDNGSLSIGGSFSRVKRDGKEIYTGSLLIKFGNIAAAAIGEYSSGSLMAYFALSAAIGGPPAFFVTGLALGFGYNKRLNLPQVTDVPKYPLITAAVSGFNGNTLSEFGRYIKDEHKQNFLAAGVKFTSFKLVNGLLLLTVSFGNDFEIGLLGLADISVPANVSSKPIAKAQLALLAVFRPSEGILKAEARLTSESYILSEDCKLTGGFAAYFWFGASSRSGDFVISLGGYHPAFAKPAHYPVVPRLKLNWDISRNLNISGEMYFALTPSTVMAGGKLSAVYTQGNLKAWFIIYADFLISWKPFSYDIRVGVCLGASYRIDWWFIHATFSIELSADLHLWGPEVQGNVRISWFIISFTVSFSTGQDYSKKALNWKEFKESFLTDSSGSDILTITIDGCIGKARDGTDIANPNETTVAVTSKVPESGNVRPVKGEKLNAPIVLNINRSGENANSRFERGTITQNVPAAMWKAPPAKESDKLKEESVVKNVPSGVSFTSKTTLPELFPKTRFISLDELYRNNTLEYEKRFKFAAEKQLNLSDSGSIGIFTKQAGTNEATVRRQRFLSGLGISESVSLAKIAEEAENWFAEDLLISKL